MSNDFSEIIPFIEERLELGRKKYNQPVRVLDTHMIHFLSSSSTFEKETLVPQNYWKYHLLEELLDGIVYATSQDIYA